LTSPIDNITSITNEAQNATNQEKTAEFTQEVTTPEEQAPIN